MQSFIESLIDNGRVRITSPIPPTDDEQASAARVLCEFETDFRLDLPGAPPQIGSSVVRWAAVGFYRACQFLVYRDINAEEMKRALSTPCPGDRSASTHYSVDLTFRFLPDLISRCQSAAKDDPLVQVIQQWAADWPLSSVGVADVETANVDAILADDCLRQLYVDRIIQRNDESRLNHPIVRDMIQRSLGMHSELAPKIASELKQSI